MSATVSDRFWRKVSKADTCWIWTGAANSKGYGCVSVAGRLYLSHRLAYAWEVGAIPNGLTIDHLCRNKLCVRPNHLEPVTVGENIRRAHERVSVCKHGRRQVYRKGSLYGVECPQCHSQRVEASGALVRLLDEWVQSLPTTRRTA